MAGTTLSALMREQHMLDNQRQNELLDARRLRASDPRREQVNAKYETTDYHRDAMRRQLLLGAEQQQSIGNWTKGTGEATEAANWYRDNYQRLRASSAGGGSSAVRAAERNLQILAPSVPKPSPVPPLPSVPNPSSTQQHDYSGLAPNYKRNRSKRGLGALRAL
jgi:hypothetical protein